MGSLLLLAAVLATGDDGGPPAVAMEFKDSATFEGRTVAQYRTLELRDAPVRPIEGDFHATPGDRFGVVPVGPRPETALTIVWRPKAADGPELWLDANGDGHLAADERRAVPDKEFEVPATITVEEKPTPRRVERTLLFRRSTLGDGLRYAVRGYAQGTFLLGEAQRPALILDGNADGCLNTVGQDRVWIDLDGNGRFDPLTEQFPLGKPIAAGGETYVVRSDPLAEAVLARPRSAAQGTLRLTLPAHQDPTARISVELISDLGELVLIDRLDEPVAVPVGKYCVSWLKLEMTDVSGQLWTYSFHVDRPRNHAVRKDEETTLAMLGKLALNVAFDSTNSGGPPKPGDTVTVSPRLVADDCLYLSSSTVGGEFDARAAEGSAEVFLLAADGKIINRGITGFS
ncbi:MAG: hypothetical protein JW809_15845 [Pirellulales bacterium]|nr:hypothetical protein [Pirellulales bacterium]